MTRQFGKVAVLMGGPSSEREVSLKSGAAVLNALLDQGVDATAVDADETVLDVLRTMGATRAFIALHGPWGEDGTIQGALTTVGMPYTGSGVLGSALAMDKLRSKQVWQAVGIPTPQWEVARSAAEVDAVLGRLGLPVFVKPAREGSSIGVSRADTEQAAHRAWRDAAKLDSCVLVERCITGSELTIAILGDRSLPVIRLETPREFYDYEAKYLAASTCYSCPSGLDTDLEASLQVDALEAFWALGCSGWGRVDLMLDDALQPYFLEVNTVPGMTDHSLVPMAAEAAGMSFSELSLRILETSL